MALEDMKSLQGEVITKKKKIKLEDLSSNLGAGASVGGFTPTIPSVPGVNPPGQGSKPIPAAPGSEHGWPGETPGARVGSGQAAGGTTPAGPAGGGSGTR